MLRAMLERLNASMRSAMARRVIGAASWSMVGALVSRGGNFLAMVFLARALGREGFGAIGILLSTSLAFQVFAGLGMASTATKYVSQLRVTDPAKAGEVVTLVRLVTIASGLISGAVLWLLSTDIALKMLQRPDLQPELRVVALIVLLTAVKDTQAGLLVGLEEFRSLAVAHGIFGVANFIFLVGGGFIAGLDGAIWGAAIASFIGCAANAVILRVALKNADVMPKFVRTAGTLGILWRFSAPGLAVGLLSMPINWVCQAILVRTPGGLAQMGILNAANQWYSLIIFVPGVIATAVFPIMSERLGAGDRRSYEKVGLTGVALNGTAAAVPGVLICLASPWLMAVYGAEFRGNWVPLVLCVAAAVFTVIMSALGSMAVVSERMWPVALLALFTGLVYIGLSVLLVKYGASGIAGARMVSTILQIAGTWMLVSPTLERSRLKRSGASL